MRSTLDVSESHVARVGRLSVRRALPRRGRRMVGAWCFLDHMGPSAVTRTASLDVGPHPHCGLQTVTWLIEGEALHRDSLGSEQVVSPGELNLMTTGHGVAHSEEATDQYAGDLEGAQLWIALPEATRDGAATFEHHGDLPGVDLNGAEATVFVGAFAGVTSPARVDSDVVGVDLDLRGSTDVALRADFEHALVVLRGRVLVDGVALTPGQLGFIGVGVDEARVEPLAGARVLLIGGRPFAEEIAMWWNFVARTREEIEAARESWTTRDARFGDVASPLPRLDAPAPYWWTSARSA
ncbi:MAG: pirin family protein [Acidimicrobiales bacterium]